MREEIKTHSRLRAHRAPGIPCALCYRRVEREEQNSGASRRGNADVCLIGVTSLPAKRLRQGAQAKLSIGRIIQRLELSHFVVRREPSLVSFILNPDGTSWSYRTSTPTESEKGVGHASAPNTPQSWNTDRLRLRDSNAYFCGRIPGNAGTANGLHARRVPAVWRRDARRQSDRGLSEAKHAAALRCMSSGVRCKRQRAPTDCAEAARRQVTHPPLRERFRANGSRECAPDDRLRGYRFA
jgi:hypothetical protein